jgi:hypothetical protein
MNHPRTATAAPPSGVEQSKPSTIRRALTGVLGLCLIFGAVSAAQAQVSYAFSNLFNIPTGTGNLATGSVNRSMAYDGVSNLVYVANTGTSIGAFDGTTGAYDGAFSMTGVGGGTTFNLDAIGVAQDGAIYGINLCTSSSSSNKLYRWANWQATATVAFNGNAFGAGGGLGTSFRIGDTLAATGSGTNTLVLAGVGGHPYFVLFSTVDGLNFTSTIINVPSGLSLSANVFGITFYTNNTFLVKPASSGSDTMYLIQYPTNFASQTVVTGTVLASSTALGTTFNNTTLFNYSQSLGFLGAAQTGTQPTPISLLTASNFSSAASQVSSTAPTSAANGNATGGAAIGGSNLTNLYVLDTGNALYAYKILTIPPVGPSISGPTGGVTNAYPPETLSVSTTAGTPPFFYQWYVISGNTTNSIAGATNSSYTVTNVVTNLYYVVVSNSVSSVTSSVVGLSLLAPVTNSVVSTLWTAAPGAYASFLLNNDQTRGIGYDTNTQDVVVSSETGVFTVNGNTGAYLGALNVTGLNSSGTFTVDQVGAADDGVIYAGNLAVAGQNFVLNRWPSATNFTATSYQAFFNDPGNNGRLNRWGDTMAVRGAGVNTQILLASKDTNMSLLTTSDGSNFVATSFAISNVPSGFAANGIAFGVGNTFWAKSYGGGLYEIAYDLSAQTNTVIFDYTAPGQYPSAVSGVAVDMTNNILAGVDLGDIHNDLRLYQLTGNQNAPVLFDEAFYSAYNANGNENAAIVMKYPRVYGLDVNNGIIALTYGVPASTAPTITTPPASQTVYTNDPLVQFSVNASGSLPLYYQWQFNGVNIPGATAQSYSLSYPTSSNAGSYTVVVQNIVTSVTSTPPAVLTVLIPVESTNNVTNLWTLAAGSRPYLDGSTYTTRGLAYDTNTGYLYVSQIAGNIFALNSSNGADLFQVNTAGLPTVGYAGFIIDQIGVADDGTLYAANLAATANGDKFAITGFTGNPPSPAFAAYGGTTGGDPGNGSGDRWGDTMAVRGAGVNTQLLFGSYGGTNVVIFTTLDGQNFTPTLLTVSDTNVSPGFSAAGIAFGVSNTFWAKGGHFYNLREFSFDTNAGTATVLETYLAGTQTPNDFVGLSFDPNLNILGGICLNDTPNDFQLYRTFNSATPPALFDQAFFPSNNPNAQDNGVSTLKGGLGFALDVNNGIVALSYSLPSMPGSFKITSITTNAGPSVVLTWQSVPGATYQVQGASALGNSNYWVNLGSPISASGTTTSYTDTSATATTNAGYYRVYTY